MPTTVMTQVGRTRSGCRMNSLLNEKLVVEPKKEYLGPSPSYTVH